MNGNNTNSKKHTPKAILANPPFAIFTHSFIVLFLNFHFRMVLLKSLNAACDLNKYLFCKMAKGTLEVEVKVKMTWGKFTMIQNTHTRMEKYHTWEKAQRCHVKSTKGRTLHKVAIVHTDNNTLEIDMPTGQEFGHPPLIFIDPNPTAVMTHTDLEEEVKHATNFLGSYCEYCNECVSLLIGKRDLILTTSTLLWR